MLTRLAGICLAAAFYCTAADDVLRLSLHQAVEIALKSEGSTRVQLSGESVKQAEARSAEARSALLPDLESSITEQNQTRNLRALGIQFPMVPGLSFPTFVGPFDIFDARATVTQSLFDFSSIRRYQAARSGIQSARSDNDGTRNQVTGDVARAYLAALRADAALETAQANVELSEALLKLARSQKDIGTSTGIEITRAQVQLSNDRQRRLVAENERDRTLLQLLKVLGLRLETKIELTDKLKYEATDTSPVEQYVAQAREKRPELKAQAERETTAKLNHSAVKYERLPSLAGFADYGTIGSSINNALPTRTYGVSLRVPVFDGGKRDARRAESASALRSEKIRTADLRDQVDLEVRLALDALRSSNAQVQTAEEGLKLAENELAQARRRYEAGVTNNIEVTDAQTRLDRARDNRIAALYNYNLARIDLGTATGSIQSMLP
jgi:outer membrane protein TolC